MRASTWKAEGRGQADVRWHDVLGGLRIGAQRPSAPRVVHAAGGLSHLPGPLSHHRFFPARQKKRPHNNPTGNLGPPKTGSSQDKTQWWYKARSPRPLSSPQRAPQAPTFSLVCAPSCNTPPAISSFDREVHSPPPATRCPGAEAPWHPLLLTTSCHVAPRPAGAVAWAHGRAQGGRPGRGRGASERAGHKHSSRRACRRPQRQAPTPPSCDATL